MDQTSFGLKTKQAESSLTTLDELKKAVLAVRPMLAQVLLDYGHLSVANYVRNNYYCPHFDPPSVIKNELLDAFEQEVAKRLDSKIALAAKNQLNKYYFVSTADHHGPVLHPYFLNSNLVTSLIGQEFSDNTATIVLSCANVSQNNSSFPRGIMFNSVSNDQVQLHHVPILPASSRLSPVIGFRPYRSEEINKAKKDICHRRDGNQLDNSTAEKLTYLIDEIYNNKTLALPSFADQITYSNFLLWRKFFSLQKITGPDLIYLPQEELVKTLLIKHHLNNDTIINKIIFDQNIRKLFDQHFEGIEGGFDQKQNHGSYLFWALPKNGKYRLQLWRSGDYLVSADNSYRINISPEAIFQALSNDELIPSTLLCMIVLSMYYGLTCLGGFCQVNYLTEMKRAYIGLLNDINKKNDQELTRLNTTLLGEDLLVAFLGHGNSFYLSTGLDLLLYGNENTWLTLKNQAENLSLEHAFDIMMPEFYQVMFPHLARESELSSLTSQQIISCLHQKARLQPFAQL